MRGLPFAVGLCAAALVLAPGHGAAQIMMGAGRRTDGTPSDRLARNVPEPVSREADDPRAASRLLHPRARPGAGVEVGPVQPVAASAAAEQSARQTGYSSDPVPTARDAARAAEQGPGQEYDFN